MTDVLGTRIHPVRRDEACAVLISDLHVPSDGGEVLDRLRSALAAARRLGAAAFVLGDLFDSYVAKAQARHGVWREVAGLFAAAAASGVPVDVLHGNRDFLLGEEFGRASGARLVPGGLRGRLGGIDTLLLHGDELCQNDRPYQRAKRWLRHPLTRAIARQLPLRMALAAAEKARRKSQNVIASGDQTRFLPTTAAMDAAMATGAQRLVFGHIHRHAHGQHGAGEYWVLPAFDASGIGFVVRGGQLEPVRFLGTDGRFEGVALPPPCPFAP